MDRYKRLASTPPKGSEKKRMDQNPTPEASGSLLGAVGGFDSSSLPLGRLGQPTASNSTQSTTVSRVSARLLMPKKTSLDKNIVDGIPGQFYGGKRDVIEVEVISINDEPFTTNMRSSDAIRDIFMGSLNFDKNQLIGVQVVWKGKPVISFRIKEKISIDSHSTKVLVQQRKNFRRWYQIHRHNHLYGQRCETPTRTR